MGSVVDEIAIKLGIQTGDLKAALLDSNASIKNFAQGGAKDAGTLSEAVHGIHSSMRTLHQFLMVGGIAEVVKSFFETAIKGAEDSKDATNENARAVRAFGDDLKGLHGNAGEVAMNIVGTFVRVGESIGAATRYAAEFWGAMITGNTANMDAFDAAEASERAAQDQERAFSEEKKKYGADFKRVNDEIKATQTAINDESLKGLSLDQRISALAEDRAAIEAKLASGTLNRLQYREQELELLKNQKAMQEAQIELTKQIHAEEIKRNSEQDAAALKGLDNLQKIKLLTQEVSDGEAIIGQLKKAGVDTTVLQAQQDERRTLLIKAQGEEEAKALERKRQIAGSAQEELDLLMLQHKVVLGIATGPEELRLQQIKDQRKERENELQLIDLAQKAIDGKLTPADQKRYDELVKQEKKLQDQLTIDGQLMESASGKAQAEAGVTKEMQKQLDVLNAQAQARANLNSMSGTGSPLGLANLGSESSDTLRAKLEQLNTAIVNGRIEWNQKGYGSAPGGSTFENTNYNLFSQVDSLKSELAFRDKITNAFATGGRQGALQAYVSNGGDALSFDKAFANMNSWGQGNTQTNNQLDAISSSLMQLNGTVAAVFPKQAQTSAVTAAK